MVGIDFQRELLRDAGAGYAMLVEGDIHRLPFRDDSFAVVVSANTLHHAADPSLVVREARRVLVPGGHLIAYDPRKLAPLELMKAAVRRNDAAFTKEHRAFTRREFRTLFEAAGMTTELRCEDPAAPLVAAALDVMGAGRLGLSAEISRGLATLDRIIGRFDRGARLGLMVMAVATK